MKFFFFKEIFTCKSLSFRSTRVVSVVSVASVPATLMSSSSSLKLSSPELELWVLFTDEVVTLAVLGFTFVFAALDPFTYANKIKKLKTKTEKNTIYIFLKLKYLEYKLYIRTSNSILLVSFGYRCSTSDGWF